MNTYISIFYNEENDDYFAAIISEGRLFCYSLIGQHSDVSEAYLRESIPAPINQTSVKLFNEIKEAYADTRPNMCEQYEVLNILDNEEIRISL
jgi:hypothetical protein